MRRSRKERKKSPHRVKRQARRICVGAPSLLSVLKIPPFIYYLLLLFIITLTPARSPSQLILFRFRLSSRFIRKSHRRRFTQNAHEQQNEKLCRVSSAHPSIGEFPADDGSVVLALSARDLIDMSLASPLKGNMGSKT